MNEILSQELRLWVAKEVDPRFLSVGSRIADLANKITDTEGLSVSVGKLEEKIASLAQQADKSSADASIKDFSRGKFLDYLQAQIDQFYSKIDSIYLECTALSRSIQKCKESNSQQEAQFVGCSKSLEEVVASQAALREDLHRAHTKQSHLSDEVSAVKESVGRLQETVSPYVGYFKKLWEQDDSHAKALGAALLELKSFQDEFYKFKAFVSSQIDQKSKEVAQSFEKKLAEIFIPDVS